MNAIILAKHPEGAGSPVLSPGLGASMAADLLQDRRPKDAASQGAESQGAALQGASDAACRVQAPAIESLLSQLRLRMGFPAATFSIYVRPLVDHLSRALASPAEVIGRLRLAIRALEIRRAWILPLGIDPEELSLRAPRWTYGVLCAALFSATGSADRGAPQSAPDSARESAPNRSPNSAPQSASSRRIHGAKPIDRCLPPAARRWIAAEPLLEHLLERLLEHGPDGSDPLSLIVREAMGRPGSGEAIKGAKSAFSIGPSSSFSSFSSFSSSSTGAVPAFVPDTVTQAQAATHTTAKSVATATHATAPRASTSPTAEGGPSVVTVASAKPTPVDPSEPRAAPGCVSPAVSPAISPGSARVPVPVVTTPPKSAVQGRPATGEAGQVLGWMVEAIGRGLLSVNQPKSVVHGLPGAVLLASPGIFRACLRARGEDDITHSALRRLQREVMRLGWHHRGSDGISLHRYDWQGPSGVARTLHGLVIPLDRFAGLALAVNPRLQYVPADEALGAVP
jgi:Putative conjugal transfer nickase/helicase TraI C-term